MKLHKSSMRPPSRSSLLSLNEIERPLCSRGGGEELVGLSGGMLMLFRGDQEVLYVDA